MRWILIILFLLLGLGFGSNALKVPFRPKDVLPVLPRQISWPVLNNLHTAVDLLPAFVGSVTPDNSVKNEWKGACFFTNQARLHFTAGNNGSLGGGVLYLKVSIFTLLCACVFLLIL